MDVKNPNIIWAAVAVVLIITVGAVLLVLNGKDFSVILSIMGALAVPLMSAFGVAIYQKLNQVQSTSNGTLSKALEENNKNSQRAHEQSVKVQEEMLRVLRELHPALKPPDESI